MSFDKAWADIPIGARVAVSTGEIEPQDEFGRKVWRTNNFEGTLVAKEEDGIHVELDPDESGAVVAFVVGSGRGHVFTNLTPGLAELKERRIAELKLKRDEHEFGTVTTPQGVLQIDERSQGRMARTRTLGETFERMTGQTFVTEWRMFDNSLAPINLEVLDGWALLIGAQVQHVFARYSALYSEIMAAATAEELDAIDWQSGWDVGAPGGA